MRYLKRLLPAALVVVLAGCWTLSLNPLYTDADIAFNPALLGTWTVADDDDDETWIFEREGDDAYRLTIEKEEGADGEFVVHLLRLGGYLFFDLFPEEPDTENDFYRSHVIPGHSFSRVKFAGDTLHLAAFDTQWLRKRIEAGEPTIDHQELDDVIVLTARTADLQRFVLAHVDEAFDWEDNPLIRHAD